MKELFVNKRDVYGTLKYYPACDDAKTFANIAGTKTLTNSALCLIINLGYRVINSDNRMDSITQSTLMEQGL